MSKQDLPLSERTCDVEMSDGKPCGRPLHLNRTARDHGYVCLMHSYDQDKNSDAFEQELLAIYDGTSVYNRTKGKWDYQGFVFFKSKFSVISLAGTQSNFAKATFAKYADFSQSLFDRDVDFTGASFTKGASFEQTRFQGQALFVRASFAEDANFAWTSFGEEARFYSAHFHDGANFAKAEFSRSAKFGEAVFGGTAYFGLARFLQDADFVRATFTKAVEFGFVDFLGIVDFRWTSFEDPAQTVFHRINNMNMGRGNVGLRLRLKGCLLEGVRFEDVHWDRTDGRIYLQDEADLREAVEGGPVDTSEHGGRSSVLTHEIVADVYRRLVNNFEKSRQHEWAEQCFLSEMEMRRCNPRHFLFANRDLAKRLYAKVGWARWLGENVSLTSSYRLLSSYGSSYGRAFGVLMGFILLFAFLLPAFGLRMPLASKAQALCPYSDPRYPDSAMISWRCALEHPQRARQLIHTFNAGLWDALEVAAFQKSRTVEPANAGARRLEIVESIVVPGQLALLLLAIRRRFRR
jgi:hypothetical protein